MRTSPPRLFIVAVTLLISTGCYHSPSPSTTKASPPSPQQPPVFYDETGTPSQIAPVLSEPDLRRIVDAVAGQTKDPIWLIRIKPPNSVGAYADAIVYLAPQRQTPRIRSGYACVASVRQEAIDVAPRWRYVQVSRLDKAFAEQLALPSASDLPFLQPSVGDPRFGKIWPMSEEEIVRITDFVREPSNYMNSTGWHKSLGHRMAREAQELPILRMSRDEGTIRVWFGYQHNGLWGHGRDVVLERTSNGYRLVTWGMWMS